MSVLAFLCASGCAAPPDEVPEPTAEQHNRIEDLSRLMHGIARGGASDAAALPEKLDGLCRFPPAEAATAALAAVLIEALPRSAFRERVPDRLAMQLYAAMNGGYLRRARLVRLSHETAFELASAGIGTDLQAAMRTAVVRVAREERHPRTDWW
jgi:hypothetical protein